ncbi:MAG: WD40 repeat domain-containing protein, partial [Rhizobiales bacterium]|nr:WD40 repeat domain-containing protein [Hyphomicrobiales bacterium]
MVDKLGATSFLAVVGTSGCGKSSLVNCGLKPALHRGMLASAGTSWRIAHMRPGVAPIANLAEALAEDGILFKNAAGGDSKSRLAVIDTTLRMSKLGLIDMVEQARLDAKTSLCIVVDQFEELFRFSALAGIGGEDADGISEEAIEFVNLLLAVKEASDLPIYVVLTMRSDFLGDCAKFNGLPEAINDGQYLVPRLTREERRAAISGPASVAGGKISPVLLTRLVNDVGDNPDQLSILQHALNRTWAHWQRETGGEGPLELVHYEAIGTMQHALDEHAENAFAELGSDQAKKICERIFRALTDTATDTRGVRRPTKMDLLCELADASHEDVARVIDVFRVPSRSFLMPPHGEKLEPDQVIDISHESLMRGWQRLMGWANEEAKSARMYQRLAETAQLHKAGEAGYWRDPDLQIGLNWLETEKPNARWAERYHPEFETAISFLNASAEEQEQENLKEEAEKQRKNKLTTAIVATSTAIVVISAFLYQALLLHWEAQRNWSVSVSNEAAFNALRIAETKDPLHGALMALRLLNVDPNEAEQGGGAFFKTSLLALKRLISGPETLDPRALPAIERTLWTSWSKMHIHKIIADHKHQARAVAITPDGKFLASGSLDRTVKIYDTETYSLVKNLPELGKIYGLDISPDGKYMATGSKNKTARLWDTSTWEPVRTLIPSADLPHTDPVTTHAKTVRTVAFSKDSKRLVTVSWDNTAIVWHVATGEVIAHLRGHTSSVLFAAFHPTMNNILVTGGVDRRAIVWDTSRKEGDMEITRFERHSNGLNSVDFSPDGETVLTASNDDTVRFWDWVTGEQTARPLEAHGADIWR